VLLLIACSASSKSADEGSTAAVDDDHDAGADDDDNDDNAGADGVGPLSINVIETEDLGAEWDCRHAISCIWDYEKFIDKAADFARPITPEELTQSIADVENGLVGPATDPLPADELRAAIGRALGIDFLLPGVDQRPLAVTRIANFDEADYHEEDLLFTDPYVGQFFGIMLTPHGEGPFPTVLAVHGHRDSAQRYRDLFHGSEYPGRGLAILMLTMRAMFIDGFEHHISRDLLLNGFALIGMRTYESQLGFKYLRWRDDVVHDRIGLIGHSGGSSTSNLTVRLDPRFAAYVSDLQIDYCEWGTLWEPWHCETVPALYPYHLLINDFSTAAVPVKTVPYGYTNGMEEIFDFFDEWLLQ
jgi:hypothetical protein